MKLQFKTDNAYKSGHLTNSLAELLKSKRERQNLLIEYISQKLQSIEQSILIELKGTNNLEPNTQEANAKSQTQKKRSYVWRTAGDSKVRDEHQSKNNKTFDWNSSSDSKPGESSNCRCYAEFVDGDGAEKYGRMAPYLKNGEYEPHFITAKTPESLDKITNWYRDQYDKTKDSNRQSTIPYYGDLPPDTLDTNIRKAETKNPFVLLKSFPEKSWDYKQGDYALADFGNFNYGATGAAAGFPKSFLLFIGDIDQTGGVDDPRDQKMISDGVDYYNTYYGKNE